MTPDDEAVRLKLYFFIAMGVRQESLSASGMTENDLVMFLADQGVILARDLAVCPVCHGKDFQHTDVCHISRAINVTLKALQDNVGILDNIASQATRKAMQ
jgi:hypothetical protein